MKLKTETGPPKACPPLLILIVEDEEDYLQQVRKYFHERCMNDYAVRIQEARTRKEALKYLREALRGHPYDAVILDYRLPDVQGAKPSKSLELARFIIANPRCARWVGQLSAYADDQELKDWAKQEFRDFSGRLLDKGDTMALEKIAQAILYQEIKAPLQSHWLLEDLGLLPAPVVRGCASAPSGFDIYQFIQRLGDVWERLDSQTQAEAKNVFRIRAGRTPGDPPRIGFKME